MNCPRCGSYNEDGARFCKECGEAFATGQEPGGTNPQAAWPDANTNAAPEGYQPPQGAYYQPPVYQQPQPPQGYYGGYNPYGNGYVPNTQRPEFNSSAAIVAIIFGFLCSWWIGSIFAIVSLVKGNKVDTLWAMGDYQGAYNAAAEGKKYLKISWIVSAVGCVLAVLYFIFIFFAAMMTAI